MFREIMEHVVHSIISIGNKSAILNRCYFEDNICERLKQS